MEVQAYTIHTKMALISVDRYSGTDIHPYTCVSIRLCAGSSSSPKHVCIAVSICYEVEGRDEG